MMPRTRQAKLSDARLDELISSGNTNYRRTESGSVERICTACNTWHPADIEHFYVVIKTHGKEHAPRYRTPCRKCDAAGNRRRQRLAVEASAPAQEIAPAIAPLPTPPAPPRIRASALPEELTGLRECRNCGSEQVLSADYFEPRGFGFSTVCNDCKSDVEHRADARKAPLILTSAAGAMRTAR